MSSERRIRYRDSPTGDAAIRAEVVGEHGQAVGRVKDLSLSGAAVQIRVDQYTAFVSGEKVTLILHLEQERSVQVEALVRTETQMDGFWQFGFAFVAPSAIRAKLPAGLLRSFNKRAAFRVDPDVPVPVELKNSDRDFQASGRLRDISVDGLGVVVDTVSGQHLAPGLDVSAEFTLPGQEQTLRFEALICNRRTLKQGAVLIGLRIDRKASADCVVQIRNVTEFVMTRQREWLQARVER